jgi:hypothetical protein
MALVKAQGRSRYAGCQILARNPPSEKKPCLAAGSRGPTGSKGFIR